MSKLTESRTSNPAFYWKLLNRLRQNFMDDKASKINIIEWEGYLKKLNISPLNNSDLKKQIDKLESQKIFSDTDFKIKTSEVIKCIKLLKNKKAAGLDGILNEMIKYSQSCLIPIYTKLFNDILVSGFYPDQWRNAYISPIFKKGCDLDTNNYRGISIISNMAKLFNMVIQIRIINFLKQNNLISDLQIGFKPGCRTSDHIHVAKTIIDKYTTKGKKLYTCFIDFRKAFDRINQWKLLYKLRKTNIGTLTFNIIKDMYMGGKDTLQVKVGNHLSNKFSSNIGVKQGDCLSPVLFNFYINEIEKYITPDDYTPTLGSRKIPLLLYADDLVIFSTSKLSLQNALNSLQIFCNDWDMELNVDKTKVVIFGNYRKLPTETFTFQNKIVEIVTSYKYLGILFKRDGKFDDCIKDLYNKSLKAMFKLIKSFKNESPDFNTCMHLFDHLITPITTYGSEIWGPTLLKGKELNFQKLLTSLVEKCQQKFLRFALGVNKRAPIIGLYGETGRFPLVIQIFTSSIKYLNRMQISVKNPLLSHCCTENLAASLTTSWLNNLKRIIYACFEKSVDVNNINPQHIKNNLRLKFKQWWRLKLFDDKSSKSDYGNKLRNYRTYKSDFRKEEYLNITASKAQRSTFAQLRLSCHKLNIERGRYLPPEQRLPPSERICNKCQLNLCEDELHFILTCPVYKEERESFMQKLKQLFELINFNMLSPNELFIWMMSSVDEEFLRMFTKYLYVIYTKRNITNLVDTNTD